jgi:hypothetical protein
MTVKARIVDLTRTSFAKEATRIQQRARRGETVVVRLAQIVFFCANQDAWMLDLDDRFARCLMRDGVALPHGITETKRQFMIEWSGDFAIEGDAFVCVDRESGTVRTILGYPMRVVAEMS